MRILKKMLRQTAVYWAPHVVKSIHGEEITFEDPIEIECRWEDAMHKDIDEEGEETLYASTVYVGQPVETGGKLLLGELTDLDAPLPPPDEAKEIRKYENFPTLRAKQFLRIARL